MGWTRFGANAQGPRLQKCVYLLRETHDYQKALEGNPGSRVDLVSLARRLQFRGVPSHKKRTALGHLNISLHCYMRVKEKS